MKAMLILVALIIGLALPAGALDPGEILDDPALEARARSIGKELRCLVCQNQSIDDSEAGLARDLRGIVRERLKAGDDDAAVVRYVVDRYGDFVLLRPPFKLATVLLWLGPALVLGLGLVVMIGVLRRNARPAPVEPPLTVAEHRRLAALGEDPRP